MHKTLEHGKYRLCWKEFGSGNRLLFAFHGFNRSSGDFQSYGNYLGESYTIVAFDLFFHGNSAIKITDDELPEINRHDWKSLIEKILELYGKDEFYLIGYSFGGRVAMNCMEIFPYKVKGLVLIASDGLRFNPGYFFAAQTALGRSVFRLMARKPSTINRLMTFMGSIGLFHPKAVEFYKNQISNEVIRKRVYEVWTCYRKMVPDLKTVKQIINSHKIPTLLFFGSYDKIIPPGFGYRFVKDIPETGIMRILETGHRVFEKSGLICPEIKNVFK